ncbi:MAG: hypothetical protein KatS3mg090_0769 [Patescibacteria group bacterium]|nr:MAG: hypothetical protein KatS3mg090_0769 [Patescibacteria group bacterium]
MNLKKTLILLLLLIISVKAVFAASYKIVSPNSNQITTICNNKQGCTVQGSIVLTNASEQDLYETTVIANNYYKTTEFRVNSGPWVTEIYRLDKTIEPAEPITIEYKISYPSNYNENEYTTSFVIDGKTCNFNTQIPDCYYFGGVSVSVNLKIVVPSPTPTPTLSPTPTNLPSATPTPTVLSTQTESSLPTPTKVIPTPTVNYESTDTASIITSPVSNNTTTPTNTTTDPTTLSNISTVNEHSNNKSAINSNNVSDILTVNSNQKTTTTQQKIEIKSEINQNSINTKISTTEEISHKITVQKNKKDNLNKEPNTKNSKYEKIKTLFAKIKNYFNNVLKISIVDFFKSN